MIFDLFYHYVCNRERAGTGVMLFKRRRATGGGAVGQSCTCVCACRDEECQLFSNSASLALERLTFRAEVFRADVGKWGCCFQTWLLLTLEVTPLHVEIRPGREPPPPHIPIPTLPIYQSAAALADHLSHGLLLWDQRMLSGGRGAIDSPAPLCTFHPSPI